jgi:hypothetical protein
MQAGLVKCNRARVAVECGIFVVENLFVLPEQLPGKGAGRSLPLRVADEVGAAGSPLSVGSFSSPRGQTLFILSIPVPSPPIIRPRAAPGEIANKRLVVF